MPQTSLGLCECGCGERTLGRTRSDKSKGVFRGQPHRFVKGHHRRRAVLTVPYRLVVKPDGTKVSLHRFRAEKALGKPLPNGAVVHHADGTLSDDGPLVICQNQEYHLNLHTRMRVRAAGGNPWTDKICTKCREVKHKDEFSLNRATGDGRCFACKDCWKKIAARYYALRRRSA